MKHCRRYIQQFWWSLLISGNKVKTQDLCLNSAQFSPKLKFVKKKVAHGFYIVDEWNMWFGSERTRFPNLYLSLIWFVKITVLQSQSHLSGQLYKEVFINCEGSEAVQVSNRVRKWFEFVTTTVKLLQDRKTSKKRKT